MDDQTALISVPAVDQKVRPIAETVTVISSAAPSTSPFRPANRRTQWATSNAVSVSATAATIGPCHHGEVHHAAAARSGTVQAMPVHGDWVSATSAPTVSYTHLTLPTKA